MSTTAAVSIPAPDENLRARVASLEIDECLPLAERVSLTTSTGKIPRIFDSIDRLRGKLSQPVARAKHQTGRNFAVETGTFTTRSGDLIAVAVVTRID